MGKHINRIEVDGTITATSFIGSATGLTDLPSAGNVSQNTQLIGDGTNTSIVYNHGLNTTSISSVIIKEVSTGEIIFPTSIFVTDANNITIVFGTAPSVNEFEVTTTGGNAQVLVDGIVIDNALRAVPYSANIVDAYNSSAPNIYINVTNSVDFNLNITGTANGDFGIVELNNTGTYGDITFASGSTIGLHSYPTTGKIVLTYTHLSTGLVWSCTNPVISASGDVSQSIVGNGASPINFTQGNLVNFTFGTQNEIPVFTPPSSPSILVLNLKQDSIGSRLMTFSGLFGFPSNTPPVLTTTPDSVDVLTLYWTGNAYHQISYSPNTQVFIDTEAPSTVADLTSFNATSSTVNLDWSASTDNVAVTGYNLYIDGVFDLDLGNVTDYIKTGLSSEVSYDFNVTAYDAAGNESALSNTSTISTIAPSYDADAQTLIDTISTLTVAEEIIVDDVITGLKTSGMWAKSDAIYLMIGGDAASTRYNAKNPLDTDAAYRLTFNGTYTYDAISAIPDGTTAYANTHYNPLIDGTAQDVHLSYYSVTNDSSNAVDIGVVKNSNQQLMLAVKQFGVNFKAYASGDGQVNTSDPNPTTGWFVGSRRSATDIELYQDAVSVHDKQVGLGSVPDVPIFLNAANSADGVTPIDFSPRACGFASIGTGLTSQEVTDSNTVIQAFITAKQSL